MCCSKKKEKKDNHLCQPQGFLPPPPPSPFPEARWGPTGCAARRSPRPSAPRWRRASWGGCAAPPGALARAARLVFFFVGVWPGGMGGGKATLFGFRFFWLSGVAVFFFVFFFLFFRFGSSLFGSVFLFSGGEELRLIGSCGLGTPVSGKMRVCFQQVRSLGERVGLCFVSFSQGVPFLKSSTDQNMLHPCFPMAG